MYYIIYKTLNLINNKTYIGFHKAESLEDEYLGSGLLLLKAIKRYGRKNFQREVLHIFNNPEEAFEKEIELIQNLCPEYNIDKGGKGRSGFKHSEETKKRMSLIRKGVPLSEEHRNALQTKHKKRVLSKKHKERIKSSLMGRKHTIEAKNKMRTAMKNIWAIKKNRKGI